ncbi:uncharacterized protein C8R40DRAFT_1069502 [Lentinula edodes]|uniref:uncharacterized protein n=1 Tax=Lentinula edodes TaxID=5353 RepID=UPI001BF64C9B|nr:uncharacterized protein C8R40DRAFT_1069502 [Lentinula edodes]KAF8829352.1 hypothetical protein HHX47_DHR3001004 [Lentinula edodes]KAH7875501.1 hypothetical protein C8R40DRAFT_1069502 [Lentinula edodes]KAJ3912891.1 hypothetical protein F5877DRAFT_84336 [Lentinula edodes]
MDGFLDPNWCNWLLDSLFCAWLIDEIVDARRRTLKSERPQGYKIVVGMTKLNLGPPSKLAFLYRRLNSYPFVPPSDLLATMVTAVYIPNTRRLRSGCTASETLKKLPGTVTSHTKHSSSTSSSCSSSSSPSTSETSVSTSTAMRTRMNDDQRRAKLERDLDIVPGTVHPRTVTCRGCEHTIRLDTKIKYGDSNWRTHKKKCVKLREEDRTISDILLSLNVEVRLQKISSSSQADPSEDLAELEYCAVQALRDVQRRMDHSTF